MPGLLWFVRGKGAHGCLFVEGIKKIRLSFGGGIFFIAEAAVVKSGETMGKSG